MRKTNKIIKMSKNGSKSWAGSRNFKNFYSLPADKSKNLKIAEGFTIVELLIVTAIIALIASLVFVSFESTKAKSRDARREEDIKQIQNALDLYFVTHREFPECIEAVINGSTDCLSQALINEGAIAGLPIDPLGGSAGVCDGASSYVYCYQSDKFIYTLKYRLETNTIANKSAGWQSVSQ